MHKLTVVSTLVLAAFLVTACDDTKSNVVAPTSPNAGGNGAGVSLTVTTATAVAVPDGDRGCRAFTSPLELSVGAGAVDVSVTDVTMRFVSSSGVSMPQVTLPAPIQTTQFGSDLIAARSVRTIPLLVPIGCTNDPTGTLVVVVGTRDGRGRRNSIEVRTRVR
jgi:hypothetical protein